MFCSHVDGVVGFGMLKLSPKTKLNYEPMLASCLPDQACTDQQLERHASPNKWAAARESQEWPHRGRGWSWSAWQCRGCFRCGGKCTTAKETETEIGCSLTNLLPQETRLVGFTTCNLLHHEICLAWNTWLYGKGSQILGVGRRTCESDMRVRSDIHLLVHLSFCHPRMYTWDLLSHTYARESKDRTQSRKWQRCSHRTCTHICSGYRTPSIDWGQSDEQPYGCPSTCFCIVSSYATHFTTIEHRTRWTIPESLCSHA